MEGNIMAVGNNVTWLKGKGEAKSSSQNNHNIKAVGKNIKRGKGEGAEILMKEIMILKNGGGEEYQVVGNFIHF